MAPKMAVEYCGVSFKNPMVIASASPSKNGEYMRRCAESGAGGVIAKTFSPEPLAQKYVSPRFTVLHKKAWPHSYSNYSCEFLATYDTEQWMKEMVAAKKACDERDCTLVGSISGNDAESWKSLAKRMEDIGLPMLELNFGCPHPKDLGYKSGQELGNSPEAAAEVTKMVCDSVKIPVFVKLTSEAVNIVDVAERCKVAGAAGFTVVNRFSALDVDIETGRPLLHGGFAGVGGPWMRPITLKWIAKIAAATGMPISATNGIFSWEDVIKCIMCGATTVQTCTAIMYGPRQFGEVEVFLKGVEKYLSDRKIDDINKLRGITLPQIIPWDKVDRDHTAVSVVDESKCVGCGMCPKWCFYDAIEIVDKGGKKKSVIDPKKCDGCGLCPALCPSGAITMKGEVPVYLGDFN
ncbi:tRNA-dihydrouridine synthase [Synergistaceae bacterium OttesenSCG-928-I11]|nr:tRNA-dihydrouridine synthase [Synergistaceae bacterium OttesenSCG-928-I11]